MFSFRSQTHSSSHLPRINLMMSTSTVNSAQWPSCKRRWLIFKSKFGQWTHMNPHLTGEALQQWTPGFLKWVRKEAAKLLTLQMIQCFCCFCVWVLLSCPCCPAPDPFDPLSDCALQLHICVVHRQESISFNCDLLFAISPQVRIWMLWSILPARLILLLKGLGSACIQSFKDTTK